MLRGLLFSGGLVDKAISMDDLEFSDADGHHDSQLLLCDGGLARARSHLKAKESPHWLSDVHWISVVSVLVLFAFCRWGLEPGEPRALW